MFYQEEQLWTNEALVGFELSGVEEGDHLLDDVLLEVLNDQLIGLRLLVVRTQHRREHVGPGKQVSTFFSNSK
jgi:hypothetical protein